MDKINHKIYKFDAGYFNQNWLNPCFVTVSIAGKIINISNQNQSPNKNIYENISGYFIPGFKNAHSHIFQYQMAGLAENFDRKSNFWTWRTKMYELANSLNPDSLKEVAVRGYRKLTKVGYTHISEFHYLHHQPNGKPYPDPHALSRALLEAANEAKINITLIPILYQKSDFKNTMLEEQKRFYFSDIEKYLLFCKDLEKIAINDYQQQIGYGAHSFRAVYLENIKKIFAIKNFPIHMHCSEQVKDVDDFLEYNSIRPIHWLNENSSLNENHNLVHCTHLNDEELAVLAKSKANVVLCPSTEANLGDGIFPFTEFNKLGGNWSIGTDSHCGILPWEELRWLDYTQRMLLKHRTPFNKEQGEVGDFLYNKALSGGEKACNSSGIASNQIGGYLDGIVLNLNHELFKDTPFEKIFSRLIFSANTSDFISKRIYRSQIISPAT